MKNVRSKIGDSDSLDWFQHFAHICGCDETRACESFGKIGALSQWIVFCFSLPHSPPAVRNTADCVTTRADLAVGAVPGDASTTRPSMSIICDPLTRLTPDGCFFLWTRESFCLLTHLTVRTASCAVIPRRSIKKASTSVADLLIPWWQCTSTRPETRECQLCKREHLQFVGFCF